MSKCKDLSFIPQNLCMFTKTKPKKQKGRKEKDRTNGRKEKRKEKRKEGSEEGRKKRLGLVTCIELGR